MDCKNNVAQTLKQKQMLNFLFECPVPIRTTATKSYMPQLDMCARKNSFKSINLAPKHKSSIENIIQQNKCADGTQNNNTSALERKMRRKSFFERICGNKASCDNSDTPVRIISSKTDRFTMASNEPAERSKVQINNQKFSALNGPNGAIYGSTSTVDSSCISRERKSDLSLKQTNNTLVRLNIKKVKLTKNANSRFDFVPLTTHCVDQALTDCNEIIYEKRFQNSKFASDFADLANDIAECDGMWAEIDEDTLFQVLSKGKY